jgi:hypothetical protein
MSENKAKILDMLKEQWAKAGPSLGGWGSNGAYFSSAESLDESRPMALNLETGKTQAYKKGGSVKASKASSRADGCAKRGKTRGRIC